MHINKLLGSTLALAMLFPAGQANAELLKNLKFSGQLDIQATNANNIEDFQTRQSPAAAAAPFSRDRISDTQTRVMIMTDWDMLDDVHAHITFEKNNRRWGAQGTGKGEDLQGVQAAITLDEANVKIDKVFGQVDVTAGKQFFGTSGDLMAYFGPSDKAFYGLPVSAIDAFRADWAGESLTVTGLAGYTNAHPLGPTAVGENRTDLRGLIVGLKGQENLAASAYVWNRQIHRADGEAGAPPTAASDGGKNDNLYVAGLKGKFTSGGFWAGAEFAKNFGTQRLDGAVGVTANAARYSGWGFLADTGFKMELDGIAAVTPWGQFAVGTGRQNSAENQNEDFQTINSDYRPGSIYGRFTANAVGGNLGGLIAGAGTAQANGLTNRIIYGGGVKVTPAAVNKLTVGASIWNFWFHRATRTVAAPETQAANGNRHIGHEIDLDLSWAHSDNVTFNTGVGTFQPGGFYKELRRNIAGGINVPGTNPATLGYFDVRIKWGGA